MYSCYVDVDVDVYPYFDIHLGLGMLLHKPAFTLMLSNPEEGKTDEAKTRKGGNVHLKYYDIYLVNSTFPSKS